MNIKRKMLTPNDFSRPCRLIDDVRGIVIHYVNNPGTTPEQNIDYWDSLKKQSHVIPPPRHPVYASAHFVIGTDSHIVQALPEHEMAYHCGADIYMSGITNVLGAYPNAHTIGIELCHQDASGEFSTGELDSAAELAAYLCNEWELDPQECIYRHYDITGKDCPHWFVVHEDEWIGFKNRVAAAMDKE